MDHNEPLRSAEWVGPIPPFMRLPDVLQATCLSRSTVYRMVAEHSFPAPVKLSKRAVGWRHGDVQRWSDARPSTSAR